MPSRPVWRRIRTPDSGGSSHFTENRGTNNQEGANQSGQAQRLPQKDRGEEQGGDRINVAEDRDGLGFDSIHAAEVQQIGDPGMHNAHNEEQNDRTEAEAFTAEAVCQKQVGNHHQTG